MLDTSSQYETLDRSLKRIGIILIDDHGLLKQGKSTQCIDLLRKILLFTSSAVEKQMLLRGCPSHVPDKRLVSAAFDLLREKIKFSSPITVDQFFKEGYIQHKLTILCKAAIFVLDSDPSMIKSPPQKAMYVVPPDEIFTTSNIVSSSDRNAIGSFKDNNNTFDNTPQTAIRSLVHIAGTEPLYSIDLSEPLDMLFSNNTSTTQSNINYNSNSVKASPATALDQQLLLSNNSPKNQFLMTRRKSSRTFGINRQDSSQVSNNYVQDLSDSNSLQLLKRSPSFKGPNVASKSAVFDRATTFAANNDKYLKIRFNNPMRKGYIDNMKVNSKQYTSPPIIKKESTTNFDFDSIYRDSNQNTNHNSNSSKDNEEENNSEENNDGSLNPFISYIEYALRNKAGNNEHSFDSKFFSQALEAHIATVVESRVTTALVDITTKYDYIINKLVSAVDAEFAEINNKINFS